MMFSRNIQILPESFGDCGKGRRINSSDTRFFAQRAALLKFQGSKVKAGVLTPAFLVLVLTDFQDPRLYKWGVKFLLQVE